MVEPPKQVSLHSVRSEPLVAWEMVIIVRAQLHVAYLDR